MYLDLAFDRFELRVAGDQLGVAEAGEGDGDNL
jgi:hypothetical protein